MFFFQVIAIYLGVGFVFALFFALRGAERANAERAPVSWGARILLIPGAMILWPLVFAQWRRAERS